MQRTNRDSFKVNKQDYGHFRSLRNACLMEAEAILNAPDLTDGFRDMIRSDMLRINPDDYPAILQTYVQGVLIYHICMY